MPALSSARTAIERYAAGWRQSCQSQWLTTEQATALAAKPADHPRQNFRRRAGCLLVPHTHDRMVADVIGIGDLARKAIVTDAQLRTTSRAGRSSSGTVPVRGGSR